MIITSAANPLVKQLRKLADRKYRRAERRFLVDGIQPVWRAVEAGADIEMLVVAPELVAGGPGERLVDRFEHDGGSVTRVSSEVFAALSERDGPTGIVAVVREHDVDLESLEVAVDSVFVGLHEVANPGNLGTVIRTADAFGAAGVVVIGTAADPHAPSAIKASMGSVFAIPVVRVDTADAVFDWATAGGVTTVTTSAHASDVLGAVGIPRPALVLLGNEGSGLPADILDRGDLAVRIPMRGAASSLNLAVAAGIVLYLAVA